jgi:hypothetical protein
MGENALAIIGVVSLLVSFFPFVSVWKGQPKIVIRTRQDAEGRFVIRGKSGDFGLMIGTANDADEVVIEEVKVIYNSDELNLKNNDLLTEAGILADGRMWVGWKGKRSLEPKNFCLFSTSFTATHSLTNITALDVSVKASVPSSELGFPWNMFPPPTQKEAFHLALHWQPDESGSYAGYYLGPKEGVAMFGSAATNALWGWTKNGEEASFLVFEQYSNDLSGVTSDKTDFHARQLPALIGRQR